MATKTRPTTIEAIRAQATTKWREWARSLAEGGALPPTGELLEAAALLGRDIDALERDAKYLQEVDAATVQRDFWQNELAKVEATRGPVEDIRKAIEEMESQLEELRRMERWGHSEGWQYGAAKGKVARLRKARPDLFEEAQP